MRSRDLPACRTFHFAQHPDVAVDPRTDHVRYDAPGCRESGFAHRLVLDAPPDPASIDGWRAAWQAAHAGQGVARAFLCWESRKAETFAPVARLRCLMLDAEVEAPSDAEIRLLSAEDLPAVTALMTQVDGDGSPDWDAYADWFVAGLGRRMADDWARLYGWFADGALVGSCGICFDTREARLQLVNTHPDHRRQGIAGALVRACVADYQSVSFGITYVVAAEDTPAEALYRSVDFRRVTCFFELGLDL